MNCPNCINAAVGFLSAYWLTLSVSLCLFLSAVCVFLWAKNTGQFSEDIKYKMLKMMEGKK
jgi:nitrogen fixation-related uncharacterized protein